MLWTHPDALRIWRYSESDANADEPLHASAAYSDETLARIGEEGFTGIWLFCQLRDLMVSTVFPELNRPGATARLAALQALVDQAARHRLGVYLYFNDPVGVDVDDPFWASHPDLRGVEKWHMYALCTSTPEVQSFVRDAVQSVFAQLRGVAGVLLITACESLTHCWSKSAVRRGQPAPTCPRCREREPADIVLELLQVWADVSRDRPDPFRVLAWNWEWAYWYADPQAEIIDRLPAGVELLLDIEIGGTRPWGERTNYIGEYSLGYTGPSQRFLATRKAVEPRGIPVHAKIQIDATHEMCSVPNLPLLQNLHAKFAAMVRHEVAGFLGCWSIGCRFTLNTFALKLFLRDPQQFMDAGAFLEALGREYFGLTETALLVRAWGQFCDAFAHYPFSVSFLYFGPHNDAPARPLSLHYEGTPTGRSYQTDPFGDDLGCRCAVSAGCDGESFTLDEILGGLASMSDLWDAGMPSYQAALGSPAAAVTPEQGRRRADELRCAQMIAIQLRSMLNVFRFYNEQMRAMSENGLQVPCDLPPTEALTTIMRQEVANAERALPLVDADPRLGWHEECHSYKYNGATIRAKLSAMRAELSDHAGPGRPGDSQVRPSI